MVLYLLLVSAADFDIQWAVRVAARALENSGSHFLPGYLLSSSGVSAANANMNVDQFWSVALLRHSRRERTVISHRALIGTI